MPTTQYVVGMSRVNATIENDYFGRDFSWLTQEICETYAGILLRDDPDYAQDAAFKLVGSNQKRYDDMLSVLHDENPNFVELTAQLVEEFGLDHFQPQMTRAQHIYHLERRMRNEKDNRVYAALAKELREMRGWVVKPTETNNINMSNHNVAPDTNIDRSNPRELERLLQSLMG